MTRSSTQVLAASVALSLLILTLGYFLLPMLGWNVGIRKSMDSSFVFRPDGADTPGAETTRFTELLAADQPKVKNLVVLMADGLGFSHLVAARAALRGARGRLAVERFPVSGWHTTFSADGMYTDSAAGATALATGARTTPGSLSVDADGNPLRTLMEDAMAAGKTVGVVTDSYLWDASTAAWLVHVDSRRDYDEVARQMAASGVNVAFGETRGETEVELAPRLQPFRDAGFDLSLEARDLEGPRSLGKPWMAALPPGTIADPRRSPSLAVLTTLALARLEDDPDGFVLFVETEEVDSGAHNGDLDRVIRGLEAIDKVALQLIEALGDREDTLIVFTGDHETGGLALANSKADMPLVPMWAWGYHTGAPVPLLAWGAGAELLAGVHDNDQVGRILRSLLTTDSDSALEPSQTVDPNDSPAEDAVSEGAPPTDAPGAAEAGTTPAPTASGGG